MFSDLSVLRRKWRAALKPGQKLPLFEDVMLGSLGRLADRITLLRDDGSELKVLRAGREVETWLETEIRDTSLAILPPDCALSLEEAVSSAHMIQKPYLATAHCVRHGNVQVYDVLALPMESRWGDALTGAYVSQRGAQYDLLDAVFVATNDGIMSLSAIRDACGSLADFQIVHLNRGAADLLGSRQQDLRWQRLSAGKHALSSPEVIQRLANAINQGVADQFEVDGEGRTLRLNVAAVGDMLSLIVTDVTDLKRRESSFRLLFEANPMPMWVFDTNSLDFLRVNDSALKHYGYDRNQFLAMKLPDLWPEEERDVHLRSIRDAGDIYQPTHNWKHLKADGSTIEVLIFARRITMDGRDCYLGSSIDITERRKAEARIAYMAHHDNLTGLANRVKFRDHLEQALERGLNVNERVAVLCIDLDLFKNVNDSFGHPMGDRLLKLVAERLRDLIPAKGLVARLGGDEFAMVVPRNPTPRDISELAGRLIKSVSAPYDIDNLEIVIGASVGIAISPGDGTTGEDLLRNADMALYRAKAEGGGAHHFFEKEMDRLAQTRRELEFDLRRALVNGEFYLHYQPLIDVNANRIVAFESLLRWKHPSKGMISPADFIPVAEDIGLIVALGEWVLREACAEAAKWPSDVKVAVNLSPVQFRNRNLVPVVIAALARSGLAPTRLELEITESLFLAETEANLATLHQLRGLGVRISMDDFGTGYSSLSYLRSFPFDKIKIDRSFVRDLAERQDCAAIVQAISALGLSLKISTTAEGVETVDQLDQLRAMGCTEVQGFLFSAGRPAAEIAGLLEKFGQTASAADDHRPVRVDVPLPAKIA
ncbi:MAG: EAL domain-containing protein [Xanthobacteraceae bacterium]|nr:EAL domain-containing protein [Xanthobacteraceae bacterium]